MHVSSFSSPLSPDPNPNSWFHNNNNFNFGNSFNSNFCFQFVFTALFLALGFLYILRTAASKYFVLHTNFNPSSSASGSSVSAANTMAAADAASNGVPDSCAICGKPTSKQCSACKAVKYCSQICQSEHWKSGHKSKCKELKLSGNIKPLQSPGRGKRSLSVALVPSSGADKIQKVVDKVLFPYDEFVKLFNWDRAAFPPCGLLNCGNSCFANVILQCLAHTRPLLAFLLDKGHRRDCRRNEWCFLCELETHMERASRSQQAFSPINILSRLPSIGGNLGYGRQEDAHEFMRFAIDTMQSVCLDEHGGEKAIHPKSQETTLIQHIFGGQLQSQVICTKCGQVSNQYENMMDLTVEIQGDATSLEECLDQFTAKEWLHGENMYKCDGCNDYVRAWKRLSIHQAPNILTIALKRFQSGRFGKINKRITFPECLDLTPYMSEGRDGTDKYKLYAVVVHVDMLNASFFGHYICYTKGFQGDWYRIDDCKVTKVELDEVLSQGAYMLLYSRVSARSTCLKAFDTSEQQQMQEADKGATALKAEHSCLLNSTPSNHPELTSSNCSSANAHLPPDNDQQLCPTDNQKERLCRVYPGSDESQEDFCIVNDFSPLSIASVEVNGHDASNVLTTGIDHACGMAVGSSNQRNEQSSIVQPVLNGSSYNASATASFSGGEKIYGNITVNGFPSDCRGKVEEDMSKDGPRVTGDAESFSGVKGAQNDRIYIDQTASSKFSPMFNGNGSPDFFQQRSEEMNCAEMDVDARSGSVEVCSDYMDLDNMEVSQSDNHCCNSNGHSEH